MLHRVLETARISGPGEIYLVTGDLAQDRADTIVSELSLVPRAILTVPKESISDLLKRDIRPLGNRVVVQVKAAPMTPAQRAGKRCLDLCVSLAALIALAPLMAGIALCIKLDTGGPVFFRQHRKGLQGRPFRIIKFRTMTVMEDGNHVEQARRDDDRFTRLGAWLRRTSLDELPQLLNVFVGDMSLIGPRPHAVSHDEHYAKLIDNYELRQHVKPGLTGWAQIHGLRGSTPSIESMYRRIEFDLWYAANCSLSLDLFILICTPLAILRSKDAY
jgi:exopolysaccharide biosynthesis polyprenyl glycosylphosphotransferase